MYHKVSPDMNFVDREKEVLSFWKSNDIQKKSIRPVKDNEPTFTLFDGPPTCLLYTSDAADDLLCVDLGGRRIIKKNNKH